MLPAVLSQPRLKTIRARLFVGFCIMGIIAAVAVTLFTTLADFRTEQAEAVQRLDAIATLKHLGINYWIRDIHTNLDLLFTEPNMLAYAELVATQPATTPNYSEASNHLLGDFQAILLERTRLFDQAFLMDSRGHVVLTTAPVAWSNAYQNYFLPGLTENRLLPPYYVPELGDKVIGVTHPLVHHDGKIFAVLGAWVKLGTLNQILNETAGLAETGKSYLIDTDYAMLTMPAADAAVSSSTPVWVRSQGAQDVLSSRMDGYGLYADYRGTPVVGIYHWISELGVAMLTEQDQTEAFAPAYTKLQISVAIIFGVLLLTVLVARQVIQGITAPLANLANTAKQIADGNLELTASVDQQDEIGAVAQSFNTMTARLRKSIGQLKTQVAELQQMHHARDQAEEQLRKLSSAVEQSPAVVVITDIAGNIEYVNPRFTQSTGYTAAEVMGKNPRVLKSGHTSYAEYKDLWETILAGREWSGEFHNRKKNGELYWEAAKISPIFDANGNITHLMAVKEDITERKWAETELRRARDELELRVQQRTAELENAVSHLREQIVERQRAEEQIWQHAARSETLAHIATRLSAQLGLEAVLQTVCEETGLALNASAVVLGLYEAENNRLLPAYHLAMPAEMIEHLDTLLSVVQTRLQQSGAPIVLSNITSLVVGSGVTLELPDSLRTMVGARLEHEGIVTGILLVHLPATRNNLDDNELAIFKSIVRQASQAITNARLYKAESTARHVAETLTQASLGLSQSLNLDIVLETLLDSLVRLVAYDSANVMLMDSASQPTIRAMRGYEKWTDPEWVRGDKIDLRAMPVLQTLIEEHRSIVIADVHDYPGWERLPLAEFVRSWLGVPLIAGGNLVGVVALDKGRSNFFTQADQQLVEALAAQAAVAVQNAWLFEQLRADRERLETLSRRLVQVQENERRYVARELHDEAGQLLTGLKFGLSVLEREADSPEAVGKHLTRLKRMVDDVLEDLHRLAMHLRPATLDQLGLVAALREYLESVSAQAHLQIDFETVGFDGDRLPSALETTFYRIVQEALTNIVRHARAARVQIILERYADCVRVTIDDDGVGFDFDQAIQSGRLGLLGMKERIEMLNGHLSFESQPGEGTRLNIEVPYDSSYSDR